MFYTTHVNAPKAGSCLIFGFNSVGIAPGRIQPLVTGLRPYSETGENFQLNTPDLIADVAQRASMTKADAERAVRSVIDAISDSVARGEDVRLTGIGVFSLTVRAARKARDPRTGNTIEVPSRKALHFAPSKVFKDKIRAAQTKGQD